MGRKKAEAAASNSSNAEPKRGEKTAAIKQLFANGVTEASAIRAALSEKGLSVSNPVIYQTLNKLKGGGGGKKRGRKKRQAVASGTTPAAPARQVSSRGLGLEEINQLVAITQKAGGVDVVVGLLQTMKRVQ